MPHITPFTFEGDANSGDSAQLTCYISKGDLPLSVKWIFNGKELVSNSAGVITTKIGERTNLLTLSNISANHAGNYTCMAINPAGSANHTAVLSVYGTLFYLEN